MGDALLEKQQFFVEVLSGPQSWLQEAPYFGLGSSSMETGTDSDIETPPIPQPPINLWQTITAPTWEKTSIYDLRLPPSINVFIRVITNEVSQISHYDFYV